mmetsp:Transcript_1599/g.9858  ORF Transcript_1599/g.9858 Transcript_1599/m.9858 type:complete len:345 (-) Transcript_1599:1170-2204(-)
MSSSLISLLCLHAFPFLHFYLSMHMSIDGIPSNLSQLFRLPWPTLVPVCAIPRSTWKCSRLKLHPRHTSHSRLQPQGSMRLPWPPRVPLFRRACGRRTRRLASACTVAAGATLSASALRSRELKTRGKADAKETPLAWTDTIVAVCVAGYAAQLLSKDKLLMAGAKVNQLIEAGQLWRLLTPALLHGNIMHLMVNCYSLQSVGRAVEFLGGSNRFLAAFATSAMCGNLLSYKFNPHPAVGASGAIFGLMGCLAVFVLRHRQQLGRRGDAQLQSIGRVLMMNLVLGMVSPGIDNWGHLGGLLGGVAFAYLFGPNYVAERRGRKVVQVDRPPLGWFGTSHPYPLPR